MKKSIRFLSLSSLCLITTFSPLMVSSCGCKTKEDENKPIDLDANIKYEYFVGEQIKKEDFVVTLKYKDGTTKQVDDWTCSVELPYTFVDSQDHEFVIKHSGYEKKLVKHAHEHMKKVDITFNTDGNGYVLDKYGQEWGEFTINIQAPVKWGRFEMPTLKPNDGYTFDKWVDKDGNKLTLDSVTIRENFTAKAIFKEVDPREKGMKFTKQTLKDDTFYIVEWDKTQTLNEDVIIPSTHADDHGIDYPIKWMRNFDNNPNIKTITIPESITEIQGGTFAYDSVEDKSNIQSIIFEGNSKLETIGTKAFYGCGMLQSIEMPKSVSKIEDNAFDMSSIQEPAFKSVTFHDDGNLTTIGKDAFKSCSLMTTVNLPNTLKTLGGFNGTSLLTITIPKSVTEILKNALTITTLNEVKFEDGSQLNIIGDDAFSSSGITSIDIPDSVTSIGARAFKDCSSLLDCNLNATSKLTKIGNFGGQVFNGTEITDFTIPASVTEIGYNIFGDAGSSALKRLTFMDTDSKWQIGISEENTFKPSGNPEDDAQQFLNLNESAVWSKIK